MRSTFKNSIFSILTNKFDSYNLRNQLFFTFLTLFIQYSITTIDFFFLEKISYLASIGVAALMGIVYLCQSILTTFSQSMVNNAVFRHLDNKKDFNATLSAGFIYSVIVSILVSIVLFYLQTHLLQYFKISKEASSYALTYMLYIIPFYILFNIEQYFMYILYTLKLAKLNLLYICIIVSLKILFNYIFIYHLDLGIKSIALSSSISVLLILPLYILLCKAKGIFITFKIYKSHFKSALLGIKKVGAASLIEPICFYFIQSFMAILVSYIAQEALSARTQANNFIFFVTTMSLSFGIMMQVNITRFYAEKNFLETKNFYNTYLKTNFILSIFMAVIASMFIILTISWYSNNVEVKYYIIIAMLCYVFIEPFRSLSILSRSKLRGLQIANIPVLISLLNKLIISIPLSLILLKYTNLGIIGIFIVEGLIYLIQYFAHSILINNFYKKQRIHTHNEN